MATVTCFAWGQGNEWEALCINFDIAVSGRSFHDVRQRLGEAIDDYLALVQHETPEERRRLLARKAPLGVRLRLWISYYLSRWRHRDRDGGIEEFQLPCHA
jgi:hypothetical protein